MGFNYRTTTLNLSSIYRLVEPNIPDIAMLGLSPITLNDNGETAVIVGDKIETGIKTGYIRYINSKLSVSLNGIETIGYRAIKLFSSYSQRINQGYTEACRPIFQYLSEDKLLDNDASNFVFGDISDAWVYMLKAFVLTSDNQLYEGTGETQSDYSWNLCGIFEVKKLELISSDLVFMLTKDGKLYHKGIAVANVTEEHTDFSQIFSDCYIHDFAFGNNTLTVLKD